MTYFDKITIKNLLILLLAVFTGIYIYSLFFATINEDEASLAEQSWWLYKIGYVRSTLLDGFGIGWEIRQYHHHKFFVLVGSFIYRFFGSSIYLFRATSYVFFIITAFLINSFIKKQKDAYPAFAFLTCILLLLVNNTMLEFGMISRPETMVMTLGFASFYFLSRGIDEDKSKFFYLAAAFAGLSAFTHLNGLSFIFAGFVLLVIRKKYLHAIGFGFVSTLFALLYFYDLTTAAELKSFWAQFTADPNLSDADFKFYTPVLKIIDEHLRFFWNPNMASFTITMLASLVLFWKSVRSRQFNLLVYFLSLVIGLASVSHGKTLKYGLLYFPYMALIITFGIGKLAELKMLKKRIFIGIISLFALINTYAIAKYCISYKDSAGRVEMITKLMPRKQVNVMACQYFYFYGEKEYNIHSFLAFEYKYEKYVKRQPTVKEFYDFAETRNNHYIILDEEGNNTSLLDLVGYKNMYPGQRIYNYTVIQKGKDFVILELNT